MLPNIESEDWRASASSSSLTHERVVLVWSGANAESAVGFQAEPCPTGTKSSDPGLGEFLFKGLERTKSGVNRGGKVTRGSAGPAGSEHFPEEAVVEVTSAIVTKRSDSGDLALEFLKRKTGKVGVTFERLVQFCHIGIVVLAVVNFHGGLVDEGLKGVVGISEFRKSVGHNLIGFDFGGMHSQSCRAPSALELHFLPQPQETNPHPMTEFLDSPSLIPSLIGFLAGVLFTGIFSAIKGHLARTAVRAHEKLTDEKLAILKSENSALMTEIATLRSSEARFLKHQGELEALARGDRERREEMDRFLESTKSTLQSELRKQEKVVIEAIKNIPQPAPPQPIIPTPVPTSPAPTPTPTPPKKPAIARDDLDFVPIKTATESGQTPTPEKFEGFAINNNAEKAESAANVFRAALEDTDS